MDLTFPDKFNRTIRLTTERTHHIGSHMSLQDKFDLIEQTLKYPDQITQDENYPQTFHY